MLRESVYCLLEKERVKNKEAKNKTEKQLFEKLIYQ